MYFNGTKVFNIVLGKGTGKTINISNNGTYNIDNYSNAVINVNQSLTLPTLYAPAFVTRTAGSSTFIFNNPSSNGSFVTKALIYNENTLVYTRNGSISPNYNIAFNILTYLPADNYKLYVSFGSDYFNESSKTGYIEFSIYSITNSLTNITNSNSSTKVLHDIAYSTTLTANSGYYLPVHINLYDTDNNNNELVEDTDYIYDMYTGSLMLMVPCNLTIEAVALSTPKLKEVSFLYNEIDNNVTFEDVTYAESYQLYIDDVLVATITPN